MAVLLLLLAFVLFLWGREAWIHQRALRALPIRIHVNGSRGKSSVTRLIAAALREAGITTVAKTTGSTARLILPDGSEEPIIRIATPNICEQIGVLDRARRAGARAMVMECMAVRPDLQKVCEEHVMRSTIGVVTNIRPDHLDVMGPTVDDVAVALSSTLPRKGVAILGDDRYADTYSAVAQARGSVFVVARPTDVEPSAMEGFSYIEHEENVATTLAVTRRLGVADEIALRGMYRVVPDVGALTRSLMQHKGCPIEFFNIFAANDLESTITIWEKLGLGSGGKSAAVALLNLRGDRIDRSLQFVEAVDTTIRADYYCLVGDFPETVLRRFEAKVGHERLLPLSKAGPEAIFDSIVDACGGAAGEGGARVAGIGNIGGLGHKILSYVAANGGETC